MNANMKIAAIALAAALVGGTAGATLTSWRSEPVVASAQPAPVAVQPAPAPQIETATPTPTSEPLVDESTVAAEPQYQPAPRAASPAPSRQVASAAPAPAPAAAAPAAAPARTSSNRQVNYDYSQPRASSAPSAYTYRQDRTFWQKHRDKLTVGMGAGGGALLGGLIGGKKGAGIGAIVGGGSSALWTYKMRKKNDY